jgi:adenylate cyclase
VVIIAARLEQLNKQFNSEILITDEVYSRINGLSYKSQPMGEINVKGFPESVIVHKLA